MRSKRARLTDGLDDLCREVIRLRDGHRCQKCGKIVKGSNSIPCHVVAKGNGASLRRFDLLNIFLGCLHCHNWWHDNPTESGVWFADRFPARDAYLVIYRYGKPAKITTVEMEKLVDVLKVKIEELKNEPRKDKRSLC